MGIISVKQDLGIPKYKQIIQSVEDGLKEGRLKKGDKLPSVNSIKNQFSLSRDTIFMAFGELKNRGIIESVAGKGYYIKSEDVKITQKVFLLFDELNAFKDDLYNSFLTFLEPTVQVDIFFHHFNRQVFEKHINDNAGNYHYYVIMPANLEKTDQVIKVLPTDKTYILDQTHPELSAYSSIYQNFETDIFNSLIKASPLLKKYQTIILLFPNKKQPMGMLKGFEKFKKATNMSCEVIDSLQERRFEKGEVYIILDDSDLIYFIKSMKDQQLVLGEDIGVISYNETLLKEVVEGGITTISTDFKAMGKRLAQMITHNEQGHIENPHDFILRNSL
ncbi:GntR family transcriptional regulator [Psychroserpens sp. BH13MA-6]